MDAFLREELERSLYVHFPLRVQEERAMETRLLKKKAEQEIILWDGSPEKYGVTARERRRFRMAFCGFGQIAENRPGRRQRIRAEFMQPLGIIQYLWNWEEPILGTLIRSVFGSGQTVTESTAL